MDKTANRAHYSTMAIMAERDRLREVNAELVEALQWCADACSNDRWTEDNLRFSIIQKARAALAKARP